MTVSAAPRDCATCAPATSDDLVRRLIEAAALAITNERPSLSYDTNRLAGIVLELHLANNATVIDGTCYVERKTKGSGNVPNALRILCPNEQCGAMIARMDRRTVEPLRAKVVFGRDSHTLVCTECGARRQWVTRPLSRMVTYRPKQ